MQISWAQYTDIQKKRPDEVLSLQEKKKRKKRKDNYAVYSKSLQKMYTQLQV